MTTARDLRSWLMTQPRPTIVRMQTADSQVHELACAGQTWARLGESCAAMDPVTVYAIDANGKLLRVAKVADIAEGYEEDEPCSSTSSPSADTSAPARLERDDARAMMAVLDKFGTLLADAHKFATDKAFTEMVNVARLHADSTVAMQRELIQARLEVRRLERDILDETLQRADAAGEEGGKSIIEQFIGAYVQGQAEKVTKAAAGAVAGAPKPNGKTPHASPTPTPPKGAS